MQTHKSFKDFLTQAQAAVDVIEVGEAMKAAADPDVQFVDVRDLPELAALGKIPGAVHASRGMIEFLVDSESPYHNELFAGDKKFILYCMSGGRSLLAAHRMKEMGFDRVCSLSGGLKAWLEAGGETEAVEK